VFVHQIPLAGCGGCFDHVRVVRMRVCKERGARHHDGPTLMSTLMSACVLAPNSIGGVALVSIKDYSSAQPDSILGDGLGLASAAIYGIYSTSVFDRAPVRVQCDGHS
jgi:hypothetical protein